MEGHMPKRFFGTITKKQRAAFIAKAKRLVKQGVFKEGELRFADDTVYLTVPAVDQYCSELPNGGYELRLRTVGNVETEMLEPNGGLGICLIPRGVTRRDSIILAHHVHAIDDERGGQHIICWGDGAEPYLQAVRSGDVEMAANILAQFFAPPKTIHGKTAIRTHCESCMVDIDGDDFRCEYCEAAYCKDCTKCCKHTGHPICTKHGHCTRCGENCHKARRKAVAK